MAGSGHVRVRVNGLVIENHSLLMVQLMSPVAGRPVWMPPGGGVQFGESLEDALKREVHEETGLNVTSSGLWYLHEIRTSRIHAVEFYYLCDKQGGSVRTGSDPELSEEGQIIRDVRFMPFGQLDREDVYPEYLRKNFQRDVEREPKQVPRFI